MGCRVVGHGRVSHVSGLARCQTRIASWGSRGVLSPTYLTISSRPLVTSHEQDRCPRRHGTNQPDPPALPEPAGHRPEPSPALRTCARLRGRAVRAASRRDASRPAPTEHTSRKSALCWLGGSQSAPFGHVAARGARGATPPPACGALWRMPQLGKRARATPRQPAGGLRQGPQASAWGPAARKGAVWAEGLADCAPWARPGHHQAASCGLRRCRELRIILTSREAVLSVKRLPREGSSPGKGKVQVTPRPGCLDVGATAAGSESVPASTATRP